MSPGASAFFHVSPNLRFAPRRDARNRPSFAKIISSTACQYGGNRRWRSCALSVLACHFLPLVTAASGRRGILAIVTAADRERRTGAAPGNIAALISLTPVVRFQDPKDNRRPG